MATGTSDQGKGARVKQAPDTPPRHFCVSDVIIFSFLPEASFGLRVLSLPACVCVYVCVCLCVHQS